MRIGIAALLAFSLGGVGFGDDPPRRDAPSKLSALRGIDRLSVGSEAPDFTLQLPTENAEVSLSQFRGKRPVALVFGSYT
jgi:hypothetical protein